MRTIVFLETAWSGSGKDALAAAESLGYYTVLFTRKPAFITRRSQFPHAHEIRRVDTLNQSAVELELEQLQSQGKHVQCLVSFIDPFVGLAAAWSRARGLPAQTVEAIDILLDKIRMRQLLEDTPYHIPFQVLPPDEPAHLRFPPPVVVKAPLSTGSKDVLFADSSAAFEDQVRELRQRYPGQSLLVEAFTPGPQYLAEVLVHDGVPHVVALVEQSIRLRERFIVVGYGLVPGMPSPLREQVETLAAFVTTCTGMRTGAFHVEFRTVKSQIRVIEVNPRIAGGAMNRMIHYALGIDLARETLKSLLGETPDLTPRQSRSVYAQYLTVEMLGVVERITGKRRAMRYPGVLEVYVRPRRGSVVRPPKSLGHRCGYIIAEGRDGEAARRAARAAARQIRFHLRPLDEGQMQEVGVDADRLPALPQ
ncbi:MAG: ATP-grasp domain-containing protein [Thermoflavifilum sp.]|nr:ATP-grasp domain-containing protein [Thermoflavifilum sp.]MCL6513786.1 ATP-grasp domain-containing protein [Alicyclobacillus sp.]